ncbi:MAG: tetratricopeptide repeat protein [Thermodesulfobacteriota bacterium]
MASRTTTAKSRNSSVGGGGKGESPSTGRSLLQYVPPLVVFALTFFIYINSLNNPFYYDDQHSIADNFAIRKLENIPHFFVDPHAFSESPGHLMYRPMLLVTYAINYATGGNDVTSFHLLNNLLHAANATLIFLIVALLIGKGRGKGRGKSRGMERANVGAGSVELFPSIAPLIAGLLFGLHTLNTQAVNYISSRSVLLVTLFYLLSFYSYMRFREAGRRPRWLLYYTLAIIFYASSLLSKEIGITLPVMLILYEILFPAHSSGPEKGSIPLIADVASALKASLRYHLPFWGVSFLYLWVRKLLLSGSPVGISLTEVVTRTGNVRSVDINVLTQLKVNLLYLKLFLLPTDLSLDRNFPAVHSPWEGGVWLAIIILGALIAVAVVLHRRYPSLALGLLWFFIAITPVTILPLNLIYNEHRSYLPLVGMSIAVGLLARMAVRRRKAAIVVFAVVVAINGVGVLKRNLVWGAPVKLWSDVVEKNPLAYGAWNTLGNALAERGDYDAAVKAYRRSMALAPEWERTYYNLGMTMSHRGVEEEKVEYLMEAIGYYKKALKLHPASYRTYNSIAVNYLILGKYDEAMKYIKMGLKRNPNFPYFYSNLGIILDEGFGRREEAIEAYRKALSFDPSWQLPREQLRILGATP